MMGAEHAIGATVRLETALRGTFIIAVAASILPYGAVLAVPFHISVLLHAVVLAGTLAIPFRNRALERVLRTTLAIILLVGVYVLLQALRFEGNPFAHPIWSTAGDLIGIKGGAISVAPGETITALPSLLVPFVVFINALILHQSDEAALALWRRLAMLGGIIAIFSLVQYHFFPETLLFFEKEHYLDSLTATFVNRNTAATFLGTALLLLAGLLAASARKVQGSAGAGGRAYLAALVLSLLAVSAALFLTKSRAGIASTFIAALVVVCWMAYVFAAERYSLRGRVGLALGLGLAVIGFFAIYASRAILRMEIQGLADLRWCVYQSTIEAIRDHPWFGTGFGTFQEVFPAYRDPECGLYYVWDRTHNAFLEGYLGLGLPFAVLIAFVFFYLFRIFATGFRERRRFRFVPIIGLGLLILVSLHSLVDFSIQIHGVAVYLAAAIGAVVSLCLGRQERHGVGRKARLAGHKRGMGWSS